tara:strand:+ start:7734 stop:8003 length:270 start_codon:yes stop_codon:yes gene_type:complete
MKMCDAEIVKRDGTKQYIMFRDICGDLLAIDIDMVVRILLNEDGGTVAYMAINGKLIEVEWVKYYAVVHDYSHMFEWICAMRQEGNEDE